jgi:oxygen-independent coproporphyrinogen-3 oxidase
MPSLPLITAPPAPLGLALDPTRLPPGQIEGLYVHVPFCFHKCHYCDFYSITRQGEDRMARFVELLLAEADLWLGSPAGAQARPRTIFFGGGTPTLLPDPLMRDLLRGLRGRFDLGRLEEWTIEANPATARGESCAIMREAGVDRLSFGAQSFNPSELATLERHHDPADVGRSVEIARSAGFQRLNVDLIYAVPGQDLTSWSESLDAALALGTPHVSCYNLTYESNTPMAVKKRLGRLRPVDEDVELAMLHHTRSRMAGAGYDAYEVSNYATPGEECRHNLVYWTGGNYIGLGPSAASHVEGWRWRNRPHLGEWENAVGAGELPATDIESLSPDRRAGELAMLMLRLGRGIEFDAFAARTGRDAMKSFRAQVDRLAPVGLITVGTSSIRLTDKGINVADAIAAEFLDVSDDAPTVTRRPPVPVTPSPA